MKRAAEKKIKTCWLACRLNKNLGDISKMEELPYADLWTVSFPCQDISIAGKMEGFEEDSGIRSSLVWEQMRLLKKAVKDGTPPNIGDSIAVDRNEKWYQGKKGYFPHVFVPKVPPIRRQQGDCTQYAEAALHPDEALLHFP